MEHKEFYSKCS
jgi:nitrogen-specific signal transduction histidine kinase